MSPPVPWRKPPRGGLSALGGAVDAGAVATSAAFGPEQIAFTIWATVHGMAVLEATHLRHFQADFPTIHRIALAKLIAGLAQ